MRTTEAHGIAAPQAGVDQDVKPHTRPRTDRPAFLVSGDVFFGPRWETVAIRPRRIIDAGGRIDPDHSSFHRPPEEAAHSVEEMPRLKRSVGATISSGHDGGSCDLGEWLFAGCFQNVREDIFALPPGRR